MVCAGYFIVHALDNFIYLVATVSYNYLNATQFDIPKHPSSLTHFNNVGLMLGRRDGGPT